MIIKGKRLYVTRKRNCQFLTSRPAEMLSDNSGYECSDGIYTKELLMPDLTFGEGWRWVNLHIELKEFPGSHKMWVGGKFRHRFLAADEPSQDYDGFRVTGGECMYLSFGCYVDFFPRMPECVFPVWVECLPGEPWDEDDHICPLTFDSEGRLDYDGVGNVFFSDNLHGQLEAFLDREGITRLKTPVKCRMVLEIERKLDDYKPNNDNKQ